MKSRYRLIGICLVYIFTLSAVNASDIVNLETVQWQNTQETKDLRKNWKNANSYCASLVLKSHDDWRLPTIREMQSLVDLEKYRPAIIDEMTKVSVLTFYWSSTPFVENKKMAWHIFYKYGESYYSNKGEKYAVRCIRDK